LLDAEDWRKQAKVLFPWKNVEAVGISLGAKRHAHDEGRLLNQPPAIGNEPLLLQYYTPEKVRQQAMSDLKSSPGRPGILLQLAPRYQWNGSLEPKYRDGPFARFKAINEFLGYGAGDDQIKLLLAETVKVFREFPGFKVTVARAPPTESPDMAQIWISWAGNQQPPGPSEREQWSREKASFAAKVERVRDGMNRTLEEEIIPALADLGLQVTLDWAGAVADVNRDPEAERVFERLQSAMMVMTDQRHQAPEEPMHGFLYHPLAVNPSVIESSRGRVEWTHRRAALAEAKETIVPRRGRAAGGLEEEKDLGTLDYGQEMLQALMREAYRAADDAAEEEGVEGLEVHLLNEAPALSRRAALSLDLGRGAEPAGWHELVLHAMEEAGIGFGYWAVRAERWTTTGAQPAISFFFQPASTPVRVQVDGMWVALPPGGMVFEGLTSREPGQEIRLATDLLPPRVVIAGLQEGTLSLVLLTPEVAYAGKVYLERGIQLHPDVVTALGPERIRQLPEDPAQWREFLRKEGTGRPFVVMDDLAGTRAALLSGTALVLNVPKGLAAQLSLAQLASLEAALRQRGSLPRLGELVERDWTGPLDIFRVAA